MSTQKTQAAIVGLGFVGKAHAEALRRLQVPIAGFLRRASSAEQPSEVRLFRSTEELVSAPDIHVVHICTPNNLHFEVAAAALRAGKHVVCEKPLGMTSAESAALVKLAREHQRIGAVCFNLRYYPLCQEARALVQAGRIGEPRLAHGSYLQDWLFEPTDWNWRLQPEFGGELRAVADIGSHWMDLVSWITGQRVSDVCADLATVIPTRRRPRGDVQTFARAADIATDDVRITTEDFASALLRFSSGLRAVMTVSQISAGRKNRLSFEIDGSEGSLAWNGETPNVLWIGSRREPNRELIKDPSLMTPEARGYAAYPAGHAEGYPDTFVQLFKDVYRHIAEDGSTPGFPTFAAGHQQMLNCEAIARSAREQRWIVVPSASAD
jgi:predicted dehydrogenase